MNSCNNWRNSENAATINRTFCPNIIRCKSFGEKLITNFYYRKSFLLKISFIRYRSYNIRRNIFSSDWNQFRKIENAWTFVSIYRRWNVWRRSFKYPTNGQSVEESCFWLHWTTGKFIVFFNEMWKQKILTIIQLRKHVFMRDEWQPRLIYLWSHM